MRPARFNRGPRKVGPKVVAKVRRTQVQAYTADWDTISAAVIKRDGYRCTRCRRKSSPGNRLRAHHIIQVSKGGQTVPFNLRTLCDDCHELMPGHGHLKHR
jgi:5-methylcytosine-specific restriction endonuclease McrA